MKEKLIINKKSLKGEDGYKTFSIRIKDETVVNLDKLAEETNRSRNELINILLDYAIENQLHEEGYATVCGVDEAGRGPLCGPVFAAACILPDGLILEGLNDSKKLTPKKRDKLFDLICENAIAYCIASASVEEIDEFNILEADLCFQPFSC